MRLSTVKGLNVMHTRANNPDRVIFELARRQHGVVARDQLIGAGITRRQVQIRVGRGSLHPVHRGVYAVGHDRISRHGRWLAAVLACGPNAVLSHRSAAALHGLLGARGCPHVTVSHTGSRSPVGIHVHTARSLLPADRKLVNCIPVTSIPRTLLDLTATEERQTVKRAFEEADGFRLRTWAS
jgi:predicted transcriptional regulator of viral defense system